MNNDFNRDIQSSLKYFNSIENSTTFDPLVLPIKPYHPEFIVEGYKSRLLIPFNYKKSFETLESIYCIIGISYNLAMNVANNHTQEYVAYKMKSPGHIKRNIGILSTMGLIDKKILGRLREIINIYFELRLGDSISLQLLLPFKMKNLLTKEFVSSLIMTCALVNKVFSDEVSNGRVEMFTWYKELSTSFNLDF